MSACFEFAFYALEVKLQAAHVACVKLYGTRAGFARAPLVFEGLRISHGLVLTIGRFAVFWPDPFAVSVFLDHAARDKPAIAVLQQTFPVLLLKIWLLLLLAHL